MINRSLNVPAAFCCGALAACISAYIALGIRARLYQKLEYYDTPKRSGKKKVEDSDEQSDPVLEVDSGRIVWYRTDVEDMNRRPSVAPCGAIELAVAPPEAAVLGIFDIFKVGIGPSSSHTIGPMLAGNRFIGELRAKLKLSLTSRIVVHLYGSLALTGKGHGTDTAVVLGLAGCVAQTVDPDECRTLYESIKQEKILRLGEDPSSSNGAIAITFDPDCHVVFHRDEALQEHPNGMTIVAYDSMNAILESITYFSIGGGFILTLDEFHSSKSGITTTGRPPVPYPFRFAADLLRICEEKSISFGTVLIENEVALMNGDREEVYKNLDQIWDTMKKCIERGISTEGTLPVSGIERQAKRIYDDLTTHRGKLVADDVMDWAALYGRAVNEENACGGRIVTAPTNGAAGVVPAVIRYYERFVSGSSQEGIREFLATAASIGILCKLNASISGAEVGCQGEIGVACAMAAAGLAAVLGGTPTQCENAAEIALEHNLGLSCDPIDGLVQVPCIERNSMAAVKAITAARLALRGNGSHIVPLDCCISTMKHTGADMQTKYRETSTGGLAIYGRAG